MILSSFLLKSDKILIVCNKLKKHLNNQIIIWIFSASYVASDGALGSQHYQSGGGHSAIHDMKLINSTLYILSHHDGTGKTMLLRFNTSDYTSKQSYTFPSSHAAFVSKNNTGDL